MNFALVYLVHRFFYRLFDFFHHWYVDGSRNAFHYFISVLEQVDRAMAIKITLRHFFEPLYGDYTIVGRVLGVIFRSGRILVGGLAYALFAIIFLAIYLAWLLLPPLMLYGAGIR